MIFNSAQSESARFKNSRPSTLEWCKVLQVEKESDNDQWKRNVFMYIIVHIWRFIWFHYGNGRKGSANDEIDRLKTVHYWKHIAGWTIECRQR